jgi:DNA polymerase-3 subunit gamma/tau
MAYTALYRKFRPLKFSDMVGQDRITRTLKNQIISGRVGHAYLFNGGRGTGKTTSAKILARAVNCLNPQDGEPCNECEICKEILDGSLTDVVEMDAASNNSVEDIRSIRDEVNFLPTKAKYRVYIIDEVHMLSVGAFNALLKTLEEPPAHVKFILATTEPQKLPTTILSRCQRFDFKKISEEDIAKRLKIICEEAKISIDEDALKIISVLAEGAMRDGISILERCYQESAEKITSDIVKELVGIPSLVTINKITKAIIDGDEITALSAIDDVIKDGKDLYNFLWEVIKYVKDVLVYKATKKLELYSENELNQIKELAEKADKERLLSIIYQLSDLENNIKWSSQKTIMFQTGVIKACNKDISSNTNALAMQNSNTSGDNSLLERRIAALENKLANVQAGTAVRTSTPARTQNTTSGNLNANIAPKEPPKAPVNTSGKESEVWKKVISDLKSSGKIRLYTTLVNTQINPENDLVWDVIFRAGLTDFNRKILEDPANKADLNKMIFMEIGKEINLKFIDGKISSSKPTSNEGNFANDFGIDINVIE